MSELRFTCALEHGIHARPASVLADALRPFAARVELVKEANGRTADVRSVLSVVALDVAKGDACVLRAEGDDADDAIEALRTVIDDGFGETASTAAAEATQAGPEACIPAGLRRLDARWIAGRCISPGFALGPALIVRSLVAARDERASESPDHERTHIHSALHDVTQAISARLEAAGTDLERDLLKAHLAIAQDPALREKIDGELHQGMAAASAVRRAGTYFADTLKAAASAYVRDRAIDVEDVCQQILERLGASNDASIALHEPCIVVADVLTPRHMMQIDRELVHGLVLGRVGATSHTAILARAMGIPALVDVHDVETAFNNAQQVIVDANGGFVVPEIPDEVRRYYAIEQRAVEMRRKRLAPFASKVAKTSDGVRLEIAANVSTPDEVAQAMREGAEGVGLFRTEMLFLDRAAPPSEQEQFEAYSRAVEHARPKRKATIIIRTFDIGGDKPLSYLRLPREENPFLGRRGFRLYEQFPDLLRDQLRAIVRASAKGAVKVMAPMVSTVREAQWFVERVREVQKDLRGERVRFDAKMPVGIMLEVPAAAIAIDHLAKVVDFFSIGTNDLCQYFLAADRGNPSVAPLCDPLEPAFLRLLKSIVDAAHRRKRWIGVCGEMAGDVRNLPLMVGLGVDEISVAPARVLELKAALRDLNRNACRRMLHRVASSCRGPDDVRSAVAAMRGDRAADKIIAPDLITIGSDARSRVEAIKELVELIVASGRASDAHALENAAWAREDTYSTGVGHGFAIPHCKSDTVRSPTIALLRLRNAIDWQSSDGEPVRIAIMLAIPAGGGDGCAVDHAARMHMQVLAKLARQLMHEDFRARLLRATNARQVVAALSRGLKA